MKTYIKNFLPIILAASMIICPLALCATVVDFGGAFTLVASAADAGDLTYKSMGDDTCYISGFSKSGEVDKTGELIIPEEINGLTVVGISSYAFDSCKELTKVVIPDTVTTIESRAFQNCTNLEIIVMSDNITSLGSNAFYNTAYYKNEANWDGTLLYLDNYLIATMKSTSGEIIIKDGTTCMANGLFSGNEKITKVTIPGSLSAVSTEAFYNCKVLAEVVLLEGVKEIGKMAFWNCPKLVKMTIPASIQKFGQSALGNTRVKEPYYNGTVDQWVSIDFNGNNPISSAKTLYINGEKLTEAVISTPIVKAAALASCETLEKVTFTDSVVEIETQAFEYCCYLKEVNFGKNIEKVGRNAFQNCGRIEKVNTNMTVNEWSQIDFSEWWANPVTTAQCLYINGELLEDASFSGVTSIKPYTFYNCASIKNISIPSTVQLIGAGAFFGTSVEDLVIAEGTILIDANAFENSKALKTVVLPSSLAQVGADAFLNSTNINYVNYTGTLEQWVSINFFRDSSNPVYYSKNLYINGELLENITIENVEGVYPYAFINCESLKSVYIADGITALGRSAFFGCSNLESVDLPTSLTIFGDNAFGRCFNLKKVNYRGTIDEWAMIRFDSESSNPVYYSRCLYFNDVLLENAEIKEAKRIKDYTFINCDSIKTVVIGGNTEEIWTAFKGCEGLTSVKIQESVTAIYGKSFIYCTALVDVNIFEEGETFALSAEMFYGCSALEEIVLPKRVTGIGNATFKKCTSLKTVYLNKDIGTVGYDAFYDCPSLEIVYYESNETTYAEINVQYGNEALASAQTHYNVADIESHYTTVTVPATCTEDGSITKSCPCGYSSFTILHAANHKPVLVNQKDATCTTDGYTGDTICEACKEVFEQGNKIDACGHTGGTATCSKQAQCERCNQYYGEFVPHSYTSDTDATCNECAYERELNTPQKPVQDNTQKPVQGDVQKPVQDNTQKPVQGDVQKPVQDNTQKPVQGDVQKPVQDNTQKPVQGDIQNPIQDNTQKPVQGDVQKPVQDTIQKPVQDDVQKPVKDDVQIPNTGIPYFTTTNLALVSALLLLGVLILILAIKRKTAK